MTKLIKKRKRCYNVHRGRDMVVLCQRMKDHRGPHSNKTMRWKNKDDESRIVYEREHPRQSYCVYQAKIGRTEQGIYQRLVTIVGDRAFVHSERGEHADILPAQNIFKTSEEAKRYLATGEGKKQWIVHEEGQRDKLEMFHGFVCFYHHNMSYQGHRVMSIVRPDGTVLNGQYGAKVYSRRADAEKDYTARWKAQFKHAADQLKEAMDKLAELEKSKPRSHSKGGT